MVIRYDTPLQLAGEVRGGTHIVGVLSAHTPATRLPQRTEVFRVVRSRLVALETIREDGFLRATTKPLPKYGARIGIFVIAIGWSLTSKDAGNVEARRRKDGGWRWGTCPNNMSEETGTDCCVSKVPLHCNELGLGTVFSVGKLHFMPLHIF